MNVDDAVICRLKKQGLNFEILVDCEKAMSFKHGKASFDESVVSDDVFKDARRGERAAEANLKSIFGTIEPREVAEIILKDGEVQLTTEYKNKLRDDKKKKIIGLISRNAVDPKTNIPHPPLRIENAMAQAKVNIDEFKPAEQQIQEIVRKINNIIPIAYELRQVQLTIPADVAGRSYGTIKLYSTILNENWNSNGSLTVVVEVPAGLQNELFDKLNGIAQGRVESKIISKK